MTDNVYKFPSPHRPIPKPDKTPDQILSDLIDAVRQPRNNDLCHDLIDLIMLQLDAYGIDTKRVVTAQMKDVALVLESVKSLVARYFENDNSLQKIADELFIDTGPTVKLNQEALLLIAHLKE